MGLIYDVLVVAYRKLQVSDIYQFAFILFIKMFEFESKFSSTYQESEADE